MRVMTAVRSAVRHRLVARAGGVDLTRLDKVPDALSWPLRREGTAPSTRLLDAGAVTPVQRLATVMGLQVWLVTGEAESRAVLADSETWSTDIRPYVGRSGSTTDGDIGGLGFTDPPDHTRLRRLLTPEFTMRRLQRILPAVEAVVERQLDEAAAAVLVNSVVGAPVDLVPSFCFPVPFLVICELLGLPDERRELFAQLATQRFDVSGGGSGAIGAIGGSRQFLFEEVARQRSHPGPGLIGQIIRDHGDDVSDFELAGLADGVFTGGLETSASMLALGVAHLLEDQELWQQLGQHPVDPALVGAVVEELLRLLSVVQVAFPRFPRSDIDVGGVSVPRGSMVLCSLPAANRDPRAGHGQGLDLTNASRSHLAFGHGLHRCVGAELARMELAVAFPALARRFPDLHLASAAADLTHRPLSIVFGLESLPVHVSTYPATPPV